MCYPVTEVSAMQILQELQKTMESVESTSAHNGYWYRVSEVLIILVCGMLCNQQTIDDIHDWTDSKHTRKFLKKVFNIERIPCRAQFYSIIATVNAEEFNKCFITWMQSVLRGGIAGKTVAIDGKTICSTDKLTKDGSVLHLASALVSEHGLVIGTCECGTKTGEKTAFRELIKMLDIRGSVVVADALHCSRTSAEAVIESKADYLFCVKDNVPTLKADIELHVHNESLETESTLEKNGGRLEKRTAYITAYITQAIDWLDSRETWKKLTSIGAIHTEFEKNGKKSSEWHYYISSASLSASDLLKHARLEWGVEAMHWLLDVHFSEDKTRVWDMNVQKTLNILRKIVINLAREYKAKTNTKAPLSGILKKNLFDLDNLVDFLDFFKKKPPAN
jgi:predicted transposase YbfD/YdcC